MDQFYFAKEKVYKPKSIDKNFSLSNLSLQAKDTMNILEMRKKAFEYCQFANEDTKNIKNQSKSELKKKFSFLYE